MFQLGGMLTKLVQIKDIIVGGLGEELGNVCDFLEKIAILTPLGSHFICL